MVPPPPEPADRTDDPGDAASDLRASFHQLNNHMTAILGWLEHGQKFVHEDAARTETCLQKARTAAEAAEKLILELQRTLRG